MKLVEAVIRGKVWRFVLALVVSVVGIGSVVIVAVVVWTEETPEGLPVEPVAPFYEAADPLSDTSPGAVLRAEALAADLPGRARGWRVLYVSSRFDTDRPVAVSGTVFVPRGSAPPAGRPVVAWAHGTTGVASPCAPSAEDDGGASSVPGLEKFLDAGYVVAATDYPGLGAAGPHPYLIGVSEGRAVLDSVRAALNLTQTGAENRFVAWGHSQGGHAVLFAGQLAADYAPDLDLLGVAAAAPATELGALMSEDLGTDAGNALASLALVSWSNVFPDVDLSTIMSRTSADVAEKIAARCISGSQAIEDLPDVLLERTRFLSGDPTTTEPWASLISDNTPGSAATGAPLLIVQGSSDRLVHPKVTARFVERLCRQGEVVDPHSLRGVGHVPAADDAVPLVTKWAADRFADEPAPSNCPT